MAVLRELDFEPNVISGMIKSGVKNSNILIMLYLMRGLIIIGLYWVMWIYYINSTRIHQMN